MASRATLAAEPPTDRRMARTNSPERRDPCVWLAAYASAIVWIGLATDGKVLLGWLSALALLLFAQAARGRLDWRAVRQVFVWVMVSGALTVLLYLLLGPESGSDGLRLWGVVIPRERLALGAGMGLRLAALICASVLLVTAVAPLRLAAGVTRWLLPLRHLGLPVAQFYYLAFFLVAMVPNFLNESRLIRLAQNSRGIGGGGGLIARARAYPSLVVPVFAAAIRRSDAIALVLASRGFDTARIPAAVHGLRLGTIDYIGLGLLAAGWIVWILARSPLA
ncbi:MAG TPA: energy-coupling factor transporter transmembrane component T [bacterium]|nr:energy-coupling factor transporter transmembrane component T [bacterium]